MDLLLFVPLVIYAEQCLFSCVTGHLRTSNLISYIKPEMYHHTIPDTQAYPVWHRLWKKHSIDQNIRHNHVGEQFSKHYPRDFNTNNELYTSKHKPTKRFLQFLPFLLDSPKQTHIDKNTKSSSRFKPFVDHFAGVRSWAVPFFISKQTEPNSAIKPQSYEDLSYQQGAAPPTIQDDVSDTDSAGNNKRIDDLEFVEKMLSSMSEVAGSSLPTDDKIEPNDPSFHQDDYDDYKSRLTNDEISEYSKDEANTLFHDTPYMESGVTFIENDMSDNGVDGKSEQQFTSKKDDPFSTVSGFKQKDSDQDFGAAPTYWDDAGASDTDSMPYFGFEDSFADSSNDYGWADEFGAFDTDDSDCDNIDTKTCSSDSECNCYGIYFCVQGTCQTSGDYTVYDDGQDVLWHDGPVDY